MRRRLFAATFTKRNTRRPVSLRPLITRPLPVGTKITITVSLSDAIAIVKIVKIRSNKRPTITTYCLPLRARRPVACD